MSEDSAPELRPELLDDFYSEADEHLTAIRQALTDLEKQGADPAAPSSSHARALLFAEFHSFKGISALAGLAPAEQLAHIAEDYLRLLSDEDQELSAAGLDALMLCAQRLEQLVGAHRQKQPLPDTAQELRKLRDLIPQEKLLKPKRLKPSAPLPGAEEARQRGLLVWRCLFLPSQESGARGVNINTVRERLGQLGEILEAKPQVGADKNIEFHFLLALREPPQDLAVWEGDGIRFEAASDSAALPEELRDSAHHATGADLSPHDPFVAPSRMVRVDLARLDDLMRVMGELVVHRARLEEQVDEICRQRNDQETDALKEVSGGLTRTLRELREAIMRVRLVPVAQLFERMPFVVRDLASDTGKKINVCFSGQKTEIDKYIIERLKDPLLHLVRNAVSHGIEEPQEREKMGKPPEATISLSAETHGNTVIIRVTDDGRGIDAKRVMSRAAAQGFAVPDKPDVSELLAQLCRPGFSTRDEADRASGRGVGMAVAHDAVREMGGTLGLETERKKGASFTLRLPLTLAIADVFIVKVAQSVYAVPQHSIMEVVELDPAALRRAGQTELLHYRSGVLPLVRLAGIFRTPSPEPRQHVLVMETERGLAGMVVDRVIGQREVVVRSMSDPLSQSEGIAGATELGDGRPVLILDVPAVTKGAFRPRERVRSSTKNAKNK